MRRPHLALLAFGILGCATARAPARGAGPAAPEAASHECPCKHPTQPTPKPEREALAPPLPAELDHGQAAVPVSDADPSWGSGEAPVTIVVWSDFECPYCARVDETIADLKQAYGPAQLRVVWKNYPLVFHAEARPAAEAAMTVFALGGAAAFWKFHDLAFAGQKQLSKESLATWAEQAGIERERFTEGVAARSQQAKVDEDLAAAARLGVRGTPTFHINGTMLVGALPAERFQEVIDGELAAAKELLAAGTPALGIYPARCKHNVGPAAAAPPPRRPEDSKVWSVPVAQSDPARGADDALVTLVLFSDFACPFCRRLQPTLATLMDEYGSDLRIVWKDYPSPSHPQALLAAVLARLAGEKQGPEGFWRAHDALMAADVTLDEPALTTIAERLGVPWAEVRAALDDHRFQSIFDETLALATELGVRGTPCSFVNGQRISGALPAQAFEAAIDAQRDKALGLLEAGQERASLYATITSTPEVALTFERRAVDRPTRKNPARGRARAKVTLQVFGDFECPSSQRLWPILLEVEKKLKGRVRIVWRNRPLLFHPNAMQAAEAAQEVFAQKGAAAFWRYHELLFAAQSEGGLGLDNLVKLARRLGVDGKRLRAALAGHRHSDSIKRDVEAATKAGVVQVPSVLVNDYLVGGVEPASTYERLVLRELED